MWREITSPSRFLNYYKILGMLLVLLMLGMSFASNGDHFEASRTAAELEEALKEPGKLGGPPLSNRIQPKASLLKHSDFPQGGISSPLRELDSITSEVVPRLLSRVDVFSAQTLPIGSQQALTGPNGSTL
jgi:hypothetical protein